MASGPLNVGSLYVEINGDTSNLEKGLENVRSSLANIAKVVAASVVTKQLLDMGKAAIQAGIDYESAFAGVKKTVDATDAELAKMSQGIRNMSKELPTAATEIAGVAEAAGQLGIQNENILSFTRVMTDLGVATNMTAEQAATSLARLANITQMPQENFDRLGSTIVALGNNFATTESEITEMSVRLAGAAANAGFAEHDILAMSAALSSVGINAEAGGGALTRVLNQINTEAIKGGAGLEGFAQIAGMSAAEFQTAWGENAPAAFNEFVLGLGKVQEAGGSVAATLEDVDIKETMATTALTSLAGAGDLLGSAFDQANVAWQQNTALAAEAEQRYATLESQIQILKNNVTDVGITVGNAFLEPLRAGVESAILSFQMLGTTLSGSNMQSALDNIASAVGNLFSGIVEIATAAIPVFINGLSGLVSVASALSPVLAGVAAGLIALKAAAAVADGIDKVKTAFTAAQKAAELFNKGATLAQMSTAKVGVASQIAGLAIAGMTGPMTLATVASKILTVAMTAIPFIAVAAAIGAAVAAIVGLVKWLGKSSEEAQANKKETEALVSANESMVESLGQVNSELEKNIISTQADAQKAGELTEKLYSLSAAGLEAGASQREFAYTLDQLQTLLPGLNLLYDEQTGKLNLAKEEVLSYIEAQKQQGEATAYMEAAKAATDEYQQAQAQLEATALRLSDAQARENDTLNLSRADRKSAKKEAKELEESYDELATKVDSLKAAEEAANTVAQEKGLAAQESVEATKQVTEALEEQEEVTKEAQKAAEDHAKAMEEAEKVFIKAYGGMSDAVREYLETLDADAVKDFTKESEKAYQDWVSKVSDAYTEINTKSKSSIDEMNRVLTSNIETAESWAENLDTLSGRASSDFVAHLATLGPESLGYFRQLNTLTDDELSKHEALWRKSKETGAKTAEASVSERVQALMGFLPEFEKTGQDSAKIYSTGIESKLPEVKATVQKVGEAANQTLSEGTAKARALGIDFGTGYAAGISSMIGVVRSAAASITATGLGAIQTTQDSSSPSKKTRKLGGDAGEGYALGYTDSKGRVIDAAAGLVSEGLGAVDTSTSEFTPIGAKAGSNYASGLLSESATVTSAIKSLGKKNTEEVEKWLSDKDNKVKLSTQEEAQLYFSLAQKYGESTDKRREFENAALSSSKEYLNELVEANKASAKDVAAAWFAIAGSLPSGSGQQTEALQESLNATKDYMDELTSIYSVSAKDQVAIWAQVSKQYKVGTQQRADADKEYVAAMKNRVAEQVDLTGVSLTQQVAYWETAVTKFKAGTAAQAEAQKELVAAKKALYEEDRENQLSALEAQKGAAIESIKAQKEATVEAYGVQKEQVVEALKAQQSAAEEAAKAETEAVKAQSNERIAQYNKEYAAKLKLIDEEAAREVQAVQDQIDQIDAQTKMEDEAKRQKEVNEKLVALQNKLAIADEKDKADIQKQIREILEDEQRRALLRQRDEQKAALKQQIDNIKDAASQKKEIIKQDQDALIESEKASTDATVSEISKRLDATKKSFDDQITATQKAYDAQIEAAKKLFDQQAKDAEAAYAAQMDEVKNKTLTTQQALNKDLGDGLEEVVSMFGKAGKKAADSFLKQIQNISKQTKKMAGYDNEFVHIDNPESTGLPVFHGGGIFSAAKAKQGLAVLQDREMILTEMQQKRLFNALDTGNVSNKQGQSSMEQPSNNIYISLDGATIYDDSVVNKLATEVGKRINNQVSFMTRIRD